VGDLVGDDEVERLAERQLGVLHPQSRRLDEVELGRAVRAEAPAEGPDRAQRHPQHPPAAPSPALRVHPHADPADGALEEPEASHGQAEVARLRRAYGQHAIAPLQPLAHDRPRGGGAQAARQAQRRVPARRVRVEALAAVHVGLEVQPPAVGDGEHRDHVAEQHGATDPPEAAVRPRDAHPPAQRERAGPGRRQGLSQPHR
jgi:hypothetical protein